MKRRDFIAGALVVAYEMATQSGIAQTSKRARLGYLSGGPPFLTLRRHPWVWIAAAQTDQWPYSACRNFVF
jgi:hypothetical protein